MGLRNWVGALLIVASGVVMAQQPGSGTLEDFMVRIHADTVKPTVDYCASVMPDSAGELQKAYEALRDKALVASRAVFSDLGDIHGQVPEEQWAMAQDLGQKLVQVAREQNTKEYCGNLLRNMQEITTEGLEQKIREAYKQYQAG